MKRVIQYGLSHNKGGIEVVALNIYRAIDKEKVQFDFLISGEEIAFEDEIKKLGGNIYKITRRGKNPLKHYIDYFTFFWKYGKEYDAIHLSYCTLYSIFPMILAKFFCIPKIILHARSSNFDTKKIRLKLAHNINKYLANIIATDFLAVSEPAAKFIFISKRFKSKDYKIFRNPVDIERYKYNEINRSLIRNTLNVEDSFVLGHIGAFLPVKNHLFIVEVFNEMLKINRKCKLILIGGGSQTIIDSIKEQAKIYNILDKIIFTGIIENSNEYMQAMDAFIFPSLYEGLPNAVVEAQASGLPCYVSDSITNEIKLTSLVEFISLDKPPKYWAEIILKQSVEKKESLEQGLESFSLDKCVNAYGNLYNC